MASGVVEKDRPISTVPAGFFSSEKGYLGRQLGARRQEFRGIERRGRDEREEILYPVYLERRCVCAKVVL